MGGNSPSKKAPKEEPAPPKKSPVAIRRAPRPVERPPIASISVRESQEEDGAVGGRRESTFSSDSHQRFRSPFSDGASNSRAGWNRTTVNDGEYRLRPKKHDFQTSFDDFDVLRKRREERQNNTVADPKGATMIQIPKKKDSALVCAAIDFGTSNSGYAYSFKNKPEDIITNYWNGNDIKTPTVALFDPNKKLHSFGKDARKDYEALMKAKTDEHKRWYLFERFKMKLFVKEIPLVKDMEIEDILGKPMKAIDVFAASIRYIKEHLMNTIKDPDKMKEVEIRESDIHWLLTVPAIWDDLSKRFMRDAAVMAGIPDEMLSLALEPEAASLFCKKELGVQTVPVGSRYIVLDLGGGTADITCHEVRGDGTLGELHQPTGGDFGGTNVDNKFINVLNKLFGADVIKVFKNDHTQEYWELLADFELKKQKFNGSDRMVLKFPTHLLELYTEMVECTVQDSLDQSAMDWKIEFKLGKVFIKVNLAKELFDEAVKKVREAAQDLMEKVVDIGHIIMVGGFSESPYLQKIMKEEFGNLIILPNEPSGAVLKGAVIYGHETKAIAIRKCRYTYGIARMVKFKGSKEGHPDWKKVTIAGKEYCDDIFNKHIEVGTEVSLETRDQTKEHEYFPAMADMKHAVLEVYASKRKNPKFITDDGCFLVGLRKIDIDPKGDYWSKIMVKMMFGGAELKIQVREVKTNTITEACVDFLG